VKLEVYYRDNSSKEFTSPNLPWVEPAEAARSSSDKLGVLPRAEFTLKKIPKGEQLFSSFLQML
jgi:hypothetical protein